VGGYSTAMESAACTPYTMPCPTGTHALATPSAIADRCVACTVGTFNAMPDALACSPYRTCSAALNQYIATQGTASADRTCGTCIEGSPLADNQVGPSSCILNDGGVGSAIKYAPQQSLVDAGIGGW
jgi:hypothetical protein